MSAWRSSTAALCLLVGCPSTESPDSTPEPVVDSEPDGPPVGLEFFTTGDDADANVEPSGPLMLAMGGGSEVDAAFVEAFDRLGVVGDVVVLRTSGSDGYQDYLYDEIGGVDSVQTFLLTSRELAADPWVAWRIRHAEVVWMAGGDQSTYLELWGGTATAEAIGVAWTRGALVGGTSAGAAVLGELAYSGAQGSVVSSQALADPYHRRVTLEASLAGLPAGDGLLFDTHFADRDRMGRLLAFLARARVDGGAELVGLGLDERTALLIDGDQGEVFGSGEVHVVVASGNPERCASGEPLEFSGLTTTAVAADGVVELPTGATDGDTVPLSASGGVLDPVDPY